jgi:predicted DNA-binding transcriptional regulator AlpA
VKRQRQVAAAPVDGRGPAWFDTAAVLRRFGLSRATLERRVRDRSFPRPAKLGGLRRWHAGELEQFERRLLADRGQP